MKPNAQKHHKTDPQYLRDLIETAGLTQAEAAKRIGVTDRMMRYYLAGRPFPYTVQYTLERLCL